MKNRFLLPLLLFALQPVSAQETEGLEYQLTFSGFVTGYIWKELADVTLSLTPQETTFQGQKAASISMYVDTSNYGMAETLHSLRYHWESILSPDLQRTRLVRIIDKGDSDSHEVAWYNWEDHEINLFRKRQQLDKSIPFFDDEAVLVWEKDKFQPAPTFIDSHEPVAPGLGYLYHSKHRTKELSVDAIDPLAMLQALSQHNFDINEQHTLQILLDADLSPYQARLVARETLKRGSCTNQALKVEVRRSNETGEEGYMRIWLSDDEQRILLRVDVNASLGMLHVELKQSDSCGNDSSDDVTHTDNN